MKESDMLIEKLIEAVAYKFPQDGMRPGLTISKLRHGYYCSVVRYPTGGIPKKLVVAKAQANTLEEAIKGVVGDFLAVVDEKKTPVQELSELIASVPRNYQHWNKLVGGAWLEPSKRDYQLPSAQGCRFVPADTEDGGEKVEPLSFSSPANNFCLERDEKVPLED